MSVQFSELHSVRGKLLWSPDGSLLATTEGNQLMIRNGDSLQIIGVHSCIDIIDKIEWSSNNKYILCLIRKHNLVMIWSIVDIKWEAQITENSLNGLVNTIWSPCSKYIITVSLFEIRLTIWSLCDGSAKYIKYPKYNNHRGIQYSNNGKYLAVLERFNNCDILGIYSVNCYELLNRFNIKANTHGKSLDINNISWSPNDEYILLINNELYYKFVVYTPRGTKVFEYSAYDNALGIKSYSFSPNNKYLSIGSYDNNCRIFNVITWRCVSQFNLKKLLNININLKSTIFYKEIIMNNNSKNKNENKKEKTRYVLSSINDMGLNNNNKKNDNFSLDNIGIDECLWSFNSRFLSVISSISPHIVYIWDMKYLIFNSILKHNDKIKSIKWNNINNKLQLAISCNNDRLYLWSKSGSVVIRVCASRFNVKKLLWRPIKYINNKNNKSSITNKDCICLIDRNHFCCCYDLDF